MYLPLLKTPDLRIWWSGFLSPFVDRKIGLVSSKYLVNFLLFYFLLKNYRSGRVRLKKANFFYFFYFFFFFGGIRSVIVPSNISAAKLIVSESVGWGCMV